MTQTDPAAAISATKTQSQSQSYNQQPQAYGEEWYWDNRYKQDNGPFDWYQQYSGICTLLNHYIPRHQRILMVGCGNAVLSEDMVNDGYSEIVNIDISSVVIEAMQKKYQDYPQLKYLRMDVRDMSTFENASFDSVVDKGMLDSLMCGPNAQQNARKMLEEVQRVLKPGGVYILITYGGPHVRLPHLKAPGSWTTTLHVLSQGQGEPWRFQHGKLQIQFQLVKMENLVKVFTLRTLIFIMSMFVQRIQRMDFRKRVSKEKLFKFNWNCS